MIELFISYRDKKDSGTARNVFDWLKSHGVLQEVIYFAPANVRGGHYFPASIENAAKEAYIMIVLIGSTWTTSRRPRFSRLPDIKKQGDWVRKEIRIALDHGAVIVPVCIDGTKRPELRELPPELVTLHYSQSFKVKSDPRAVDDFDTDMFKIGQFIDEQFPGRYPGITEDPIIFEAADENRLFTGREAILEKVHERLTASRRGTDAHSVAITGLGGMGKTQTAIEYAHRYFAGVGGYPKIYKSVFWVNADTTGTLYDDFKRLAGTLNLPEKESQDQQRVIDAVKKWFNTHASWLLVFDNADDPAVVSDFLPTSSKGHILLTTRDAAPGRIADPIPLDAMSDEEGAQFLLKRVGIGTMNASVEQQRLAREITREMGGLPLALEQAGAYITATSAPNQVSLADYLERYRTGRAELQLLRAGAPAAHQEPVATTWYLYKKVMQNNPASLEVLRLFAFLAPDDIPEEIVTNKKEMLGSVLAAIADMNEVCATLSRFSLIQRGVVDGKNTVGVHRLVQAVIQDDMDAASQRHWAERAILATDTEYPDRVNKEVEWPKCQLYLAHAVACAGDMQRYALAPPEGAHLLKQAGHYLRLQSRFRESEALLRQALAVHEDIERMAGEGPNAVAARLNVASSIDGLATLYFDQYLYRTAEPLYQSSLAIREATLGQKDEKTIETLNRFALNYWYMGNTAQSAAEREQCYAKAGALYDTILPISIQLAGRADSDLTLLIRNNQALLYRSLGRYPEAIQINIEVGELRAAKVRADPKREKGTLAQSLQNLAVTYLEQGDASKYAEAVELLKRALAIRLELFPTKKSAQVARSYRYLGRAYAMQGNDAEAAPQYHEAVGIWNDVLDDPSQFIEALREYLAILRRLGRDKEAALIEEQITRAEQQQREH